MSKRFVLVVVSVLAVFVGSAAGYTAVHGTSHSQRLTVTHWSQSNPGAPVSVGAGAAKMLAQFSSSRVGQLGQVFLLRQVAARGLYRVASASSYACYGAGPAASSSRVDDFDVIECPIDPAFPSSGRPVMDFSVLTTVHGSLPHYTRVEGVAADGVTAVGLLDASGKVIDRVPVTSNVYAYVPTRPDVAGIVAFDSAGNSVPVQPKP